MKFHGPSVAIGVVASFVAAIASRRLRPVGVEIAALGIELAKTLRALIERERESAEDFWYEVHERVAARAKRKRREQSENPTPKSSES